jgi:NAD(P)-dependent dehydrogenase (short-subunit alcohol dehydrogenase family)
MGVNSLNNQLDGKVALVTGAAGSLGQAVARQFDQAGARLALFDRAEARLHALYPEWVESRRHLLVGSIDLVDQEAVNEAVSTLVKTFGKVDVLANIAGGYRAGTPVHEIQDQEWKFMLDLNARTVLNMSRAVVPHMLKRSYGKVINIGARPGLKGVSEAGPYAASKSAVMRLTESMSAELKHKGININCVIPGTIDTPDNRNNMPDANFERWVRLEDLAKVILFLSCDSSKAIHGALIPVYGTG